MHVETAIKRLELAPSLKYKLLTPAPPPPPAWGKGRFDKSLCVCLCLCMRHEDESVGLACDSREKGDECRYNYFEGTITISDLTGIYTSPPPSTTAPFQSSMQDISIHREG
jgi:hypothetical protein